jgi:hypothetical protein
MLCCTSMLNVWSHNCNWCGVDEQSFILEHLDKIGRRRDELLSDASSVYLYDLSQSP